MGSPLAGYVRLVLQPEGTTEAPDCARWVEACPTEAGCLGGALLPAATEGGGRRLIVQPRVPGLYRVCHALETVGLSLVEQEETFTLQPNMTLSVTYAVTSVSPRALLVNKRTRLEIPGAVPGDHVRLVRVRRVGDPCRDSPNEMNAAILEEYDYVWLRPSANLLASSDTYVLCLAFNNSQKFDSDFYPQGTLNVTVSYPISTIVALDVDARPAALAARRQLSLRLDAADGNHVEAGDAVVILPTSKVGAGDCAEAWYYYDLHACSGSTRPFATTSPRASASSRRRSSTPSATSTRRTTPSRPTASSPASPTATSRCAASGRPAPPRRRSDSSPASTSSATPTPPTSSAPRRSSRPRRSPASTRRRRRRPSSSAAPAARSPSAPTRTASIPTDSSKTSDPSAASLASNSA